MQQNFIVQINLFSRYLETHYLSPGAQLLWFKLFLLFNRSNWQEWVTVDLLRMMTMIGVQSEHSVVRVRDELVEAGLIEYRKGKKRQPNQYKMLYFPCNICTGNDGVSDRDGDSRSGGKTTGIYKHKPKQKPSDTPAASYDIALFEKQLWEPVVPDSAAADKTAAPIAS